MKLVGSAEVDPLYLLLHEPNKFVDHPFNDTVVASVINARIAASMPDDKLAWVVMVPPSETGLSRWRLRWHFYGSAEEEYTADRGLSRAADIRFVLPVEVVAVLRRMKNWTVEVR